MAVLGFRPLSAVHGFQASGYAGGSVSGIQYHFGIHVLPRLSPYRTNRKWVNFPLSIYHIRSEDVKDKKLLKFSRS